MDSTLEKILGRDVSRETQERLRGHFELLRKWNSSINLVSPGSVSDGWTRHIIDSVQVLACSDLESGHWLDFGTGGGFPGLVCAIVARELRPEVRFTFVESDKRKSAFLSSSVRALGLTARVAARRVESLPPQQADVISARAVASLPKLLDYAEPHLATGAICIFPKGKNPEPEMEQARAQWRFKLTRKPSITNANAAILVLGEIERV